MLYEKERQEVVETCQFMVKENLVVGTAGNVSVRIGDHVVISPSGLTTTRWSPRTLSYTTWMATMWRAS
nr:class II aldolase/adducin family protein [Flaviflexus ciconiae]